MEVKKELEAKLKGIFDFEKEVFLCPATRDELERQYRVLSTLSPRERESGLIDAEAFHIRQKCLGIIFESHLEYDTVLDRMSEEVFEGRLERVHFLAYKWALHMIHHIDMETLRRQYKLPSKR